MAKVTGYTKTQIDTLLSNKADALGPDDNYVTNSEKTALANLGTAAPREATFAPDPDHPGLYLLATGSGITADPDHPGLYLMGALA